jgi:hypothetical protein
MTADVLHALVSEPKKLLGRAMPANCTVEVFVNRGGGTQVPHTAIRT